MPTPHDEISPLAALARAAAERAPDAVALLAPGRAALRYEGLARLVDRTARTLRAAGFAPGARIALSLPDGPEAAAAFLAIASAATVAPLHPAAGEREVRAYLCDLRPAAIVLEPASSGHLRAVAEALGIATIELSRCEAAPAGDFDLAIGARKSVPGADLRSAPDVALLLPTSGTTARPKIVPITHASLCTSAAAIAASLALTPDDRCLGVMPLFHVHGLVGGFLSSVSAGASLVATPGFDAGRFFAWAADLGATWYTAVPTIHAGVRDAARGRARARSFRFARSCSAAIPVSLIRDLEAALGAPLVEAYGMTEAAHQISCNPLPPGERRPGSVGRPCGVEVAVLDPAGGLLPSGETGEVVLRGPTITRGYQDNPDATRASFHDGWFRTGDRGRVDADGYLWLDGRLKELVNRGGEKIAPREVEEALLAHPRVVSAAAFAIPHPRLGEDVGAAVVLRGGGPADEADLRRFAAGRLAAHKVPRRIVAVEMIPAGPTGKPQRIGLAERLGIGAGAGPAAAWRAPGTPEESAIAAIWANVLGAERIGADDDFFHLGGDSLEAMRILARVRERWAIVVTPQELFEAPTIAALAALVLARRAAPGGVEELLAEVEGLSDAELARRLGGADPGP